jgi:hypothetical protein
MISTELPSFKAMYWSFIHSRRFEVVECLTLYAFVAWKLGSSFKRYNYKELFFDYTLINLHMIKVSDIGP